jgi:hypothetical protein
MTIEKGERVTPEVLHWECRGGTVHFWVRCNVTGKALVITYTATRREGGKVKGETRTGVLVRQ